MTKTLILFFHPDFAHSKANVVLAAAAAKLPAVEVVDMQATYSDGTDISKDGEREALDAAAVEYAATLKRWIVSSTALGVKELEPRRAAQ